MIRQKVFCSGYCSGSEKCCHLVSLSSTNEVLSSSTILERRQCLQTCALYIGWSYLQCLEDGPAVGGQLGVGRLAEELGEGSDGVQFVCRNLERKLWHQTRYELNKRQLISLSVVVPTSENLPSPNHCSHLMPWLACRLPVARHVTTMPGHQEKPLILPHTSSPIPKPLLSWMEEEEQW